MGDYRTANESANITNDADSSIGVASSSARKPRVLVTGFGPFGEHAINASWESVQQLRTFPDLTESVELIIKEIPVEYSQVTSIVPALWRQYQPDLVIHCGVSAVIAWKNFIHIERKAHSFGYLRPDVNLQVPHGGCCVASRDSEEQCLHTGIDVEQLAEMEVGRSENCVLSCQVSEDAGRYLCEFIYFTSLSIDNSLTLFIHVPPLYKPFSAREIARAIKKVILKILKQRASIPAAIREAEEMENVAITATVAAV